MSWTGVLDFYNNVILFLAAIIMFVVNDIHSPNLPIPEVVESSA